MLFRNVGAPWSRHGIELHRGKAALHDVLGSPGVVLRLLHLVAPAIRVHPNARTAWTTKEIVDRLLRDLADDVPQSLLNAGRGTVELQRAASLRIVVESNLQYMADVKGVATDDIAAEFFDLRRDGAVAIVLAVGFAPSNDLGIGLNAHEYEILAP